MNKLANYFIKKAAKEKLVSVDDAELNDFLTLLSLREYYKRLCQIMQNREENVPLYTSLGLAAGVVGGGALGKCLEDKFDNGKKYSVPVGMLVGGALGAGASAYLTDKYYENKLKQPMEMSFTHYSAE